MSTLSYHQKVTVNELQMMPTPPPTDTHVPIPHYTAVTEILNQLDKMGYEYTNLDVGVSHEQQRAYWMMDLENKSIARDWGTTIGGWNSHDKVLRYSIVAGPKLYICANQWITGEIKVATKHTSKIMQRLPRMVTRALFKLSQHDKVNTERIAYYKDHEMPTENWVFHPDGDNQKVYDSSPQIHDMVVRSLDLGIINSSSVQQVLKEWREPRYEAFEPRTAWTLCNAYTEVFKKYSNPLQLSERGIKLTAMLDNEVGYEAPILAEMPEDEEIIVN